VSRDDHEERDRSKLCDHREGDEIGAQVLSRRAELPSMRSSRLYLAKRSPRQGAPVLSCPARVATVKSEMKPSLVSFTISALVTKIGAGALDAFAAEAEPIAVPQLERLAGARRRNRRPGGAAE
jgi:hypothetical protein